jgi:hypothetical protein
VVVPIFSLQFHVPSLAGLVFSAALMLAVTAAAFLVPRAASQRARPRSGRRRGTAWVALVATASHFVLTYAVPHLGLPWPLGVVIALAPVALGVAVIRALDTTGLYGSDGLRVVCGMASFFLLLDVVIGLGGRYDLSLGAVLAAAGLCWMVKTKRPSVVANSAGQPQNGPEHHRA